MNYFFRLNYRNPFTNCWYFHFLHCDASWNNSYHEKKPHWIRRKMEMDKLFCMKWAQEHELYTVILQHSIWLAVSQLNNEITLVGNASKFIFSVDDWSGECRNCSQVHMPPMLHVKLGFFTENSNSKNNKHFSLCFSFDLWCNELCPGFIHRNHDRNCE